MALVLIVAVVGGGAVLVARHRSRRDESAASGGSGTGDLAASRGLADFEPTTEKVAGLGRPPGTTWKVSDEGAVKPADMIPACLPEDPVPTAEYRRSWVRSVSGGQSGEVTVWITQMASAGDAHSSLVARQSNAYRDCFSKQIRTELMDDPAVSSADLPGFVESFGGSTAVPVLKFVVTEDFVGFGRSCTKYTTVRFAQVGRYLVTTDASTCAQPFSPSAIDAITSDTEARLLAIT